MGGCSHACIHTAYMQAHCACSIGICSYISRALSGERCRHTHASVRVRAAAGTLWPGGSGLGHSTASFAGTQARAGADQFTRALHLAATPRPQATYPSLGNARCCMRSLVTRATTYSRPSATTAATGLPGLPGSTCRSSSSSTLSGNVPGPAAACPSSSVPATPQGCGTQRWGDWLTHIAGPATECAQPASAGGLGAGRCPAPQVGERMGRGS